MEAHFTDRAVKDRLVDIPGARNFRDLGGYPAASDRTVRRGMLFRSGHPGEMSAERQRGLLELGLRAIVDLRTTEERDNTPFDPELREALRYWARDYSFSRGDLFTLLKDPSVAPEAVEQRMIDTYRALPMEQSEAVAALFGKLLRGDYPLLVCCSAGKDRTGVLSALVLTALGVSRELILRDYGLTERLHPPLERLFKVDPHSPLARSLDVDPSILLPVMSSPTAYLDAMFDALAESHGGVEGYLAKEHEIGAPQLEQLRAALLEG